MRRTVLLAAIGTLFIALFIINCRPYETKPVPENDFHAVIVQAAENVEWQRQSIGVSFGANRENADQPGEIIQYQRVDAKLRKTSPATVPDLLEAILSAYSQHAQTESQIVFEPRDSPMRSLRFELVGRYRGAFTVVAEDRGDIVAILGFQIISVIPQSAAERL
jgi:hypothetical protein